MYMYMYMYMYIYIYICIYLVRHGNVLMFFFKGFHRRDSRGPVAAGNHKQTNDGNHKQTFLATTETMKKPAPETSPKNTTNEESLDTF